MGYPKSYPAKNHGILCQNLEEYKKANAEYTARRNKTFEGKLTAMKAQQALHTRVLKENPDKYADAIINSLIKKGAY